MYPRLFFNCVRRSLWPLLLCVAVWAVGGATPASATDFGTAISTLTTIHRSQKNNLPVALEIDEPSGIRNNYIAAQLALAEVADLPTDDPGRAQVFRFCLDLLGKRVGTSGFKYLKKQRVYNSIDTPLMAFMRERFYFTCTTAMPDRDSRDLIALAGAFPERYRAILVNHGVYVGDNFRLNASQLDYLDRLLSAVPHSLHNLEVVTTLDLIGDLPADVEYFSFYGPLLSAINIFSTPLGEFCANTFPDDLPPKEECVFASTAAHELNHIVDAYGVTRSPVLAQRRDALIRRAGSDPLNYLRSMFEPGFFQNAPQEFFASIASLFQHGMSLNGVA